MSYYNYSNFARRKGSKNKKGLKTAGVVGGGLAGAATLGLGAYAAKKNLRALGQKIAGRMSKGKYRGKGVGRVDRGMAPVLEVQGLNKGRALPPARQLSLPGANTTKQSRLGKATERLPGTNPVKQKRLPGRKKK